MGSAEGHAGGTPEVRYAVAGGVARLTLSQPARRNAMTLAMWSSLPDLVARAAADEAVRAILLTGEGGEAFCAGADITQFAGARTGEAAVAAYDAAVDAAYRAVGEAAKPTVAAIEGACFGGGFALALLCDLRVARAGARFRIPAARLGLGYGYAGVRALVQRLGPSTTADLLFTARVVEAEEARHLGILARVWPAATYGAELDALLASLAGNAPLTLRAAKRALIELSRPEAVRDLTAVEGLVAACFGSADYREGQAAFRERREPAFRGA